MNSTLEEVCESEDELKAAIIKLFESGTERYINHCNFFLLNQWLCNLFFFFYSVRTKNQIQFLNVNERECLNVNDENRPVGVEFYFVNSDGEHNTYMHEEFINLLDNHRFEYKSNVRVAK